MVGLTVRRLISKGQSNKMPFTHTSPCGLQRRSQCVFCHNLRRAISRGGKGRGGLKPGQCVNVCYTKISCQLTSLDTRDNVEGGPDRTQYPYGGGDALGVLFVCLFLILQCAALNLIARLIYIVAQNPAFTMSSQLKGKQPH